MENVRLPVVFCQDCLWMPKCVKRGWFLPYTPPDHEYGAWKRHYVACACSLDYLTPTETAEMYGVLEEPKKKLEGSEDEWNERLLRRLIQDGLAGQKIFSEWLWNDGDPAPPATYFNERKLQEWSRTAQLQEEVLRTVRKQMRPYFRQLQQDTCARMIGQLMFDSMSTTQMLQNQELAQTLTEGLIAMMREKQNRSPRGKFVEKRTQFARETLRSEQNYVQTLEIVKDIYWVRLRAALASNRAVLSMANIHIIFSDILLILELNRSLLRDLRERLSEWGPSQCLGDVFVKFSTRLTNYTNFFNNYSTILKTIDKCRNTSPGFRVFLTRHDRSAVTKMLSLQEMLLSPSRRFDEYVILLSALRLHTPIQHVDRHDLAAAIANLKRFRDYIQQLKVRHQRDQEIVEAQSSIAGSPILLEANRYLIQVQEVTQMSCLDGKICPSFRIYEHINDMNLFLFNDALVFTSRTVAHLPFERTAKMSLQFLAAVALSRLLIEDIPDSKYIQNAFAMQGPKRQWICATETEEDKMTWLSCLASAIRAAMREA
ncbi:hypothetical protein chiPu_0011442 [Chiloscyllium punctatum]|uniref:DH domain-containing protein n=1 Tax=Chiloscyllium punctatum TaxID=137246 RepID=A0A401SRF7_CHIPU|nr:hypothetical protein [Chiloscyllium punctatum]